MNTDLRAAIHTAHDHLHAGRVNEAHEALHCGINDTPVSPANITADSATSIQAFVVRFNELCADTGVMACTVVMVPSKSRQGFVSIQIGGHVPTIQTVRNMMGMEPTKAAL